MGGSWVLKILPEAGPVQTAKVARSATARHVKVMISLTFDRGVFGPKNQGRGGYLRKLRAMMYAGCRVLSDRSVRMRVVPYPA